MVLVAATLPLLFVGVAFGQLLTFDENGNSSFQPGFIGNDPGPGGLNGVLVYPLPFAGTQGDVLMQEGAGGPILDVVRFNGNATLIFYSDNVGGADALADTVAPPGAFYGNQIVIVEVGPEGNNGAFYTPLPGQPGFEPTLPRARHVVLDGNRSCRGRTIWLAA